MAVLKNKENFMKMKGILVFTSLLLVSMFFIACSPTGDNKDKDTRVAVTFESVVANGTSGTADSTQLRLTFSVDPTSLAASDITVTGATKGALNGTGLTRTLAISNITIANGETVSVAITSPSGFAITGSPKTAVVYKGPYSGMAYQGGIVAYIFQAEDPGYVEGETHGIIVSLDDLNGGAGIPWSIGSSVTTGANGTGLGTGLSNTTTIITAHGDGTYAAKLCADYTNDDTGTGVYDDWFLPSREELNKVYLNKVATGLTFKENYWSSTENSQLSAIYISFATGSISPNGKGDSSPNVRAIRTF